MCNSMCVSSLAKNLTNNFCTQSILVGGVVGRNFIHGQLWRFHFTIDSESGPNGIAGTRIFWRSLIELSLHRWHWTQVYCTRRSTHSCFIRTDIGAVRVYGTNWTLGMVNHIFCNPIGIEHRSHFAQQQYTRC